MSEIDHKSEIYKPNYNGLWDVIIYNDNFRSRELLMTAILTATNYPLIRALELVNYIENEEAVIIYTGNYEEAQSMASILRQTGILIEINEATSKD